MKNAIGGTLKVWPNRVVIVTSRMCGPGVKRLLSMMKFGPPTTKEQEEYSQNTSLAFEPSHTSYKTHNTLIYAS